MAVDQPVFCGSAIHSFHLLFLDTRWRRGAYLVRTKLPTDNLHCYCAVNGPAIGGILMKHKDEEMAGLMDKAKNFVAEHVAQIKKPEAELTDVDLKNVTRDSVHFKSQISVTNPYDHSIPICDIAYTLKSANKIIASGKIADPGSIVAEGVTMLDVEMKVPYSVLADIARDIGSDWDVDYHLEVKFTVDLPIIGNFTIPLEKKGEFKLPSFSDLF
ncbi:hypothetical protein IFM89_016387 [Coptis chinensis]|uniref:Water stress and hypersensitive response domain-containing protein n=1 Tax=Coptis chinensis TaxID=261450 RepID=A0A835HDL4_9MAGN|nr:hypothetical protein IFM89_016387 [Coptis chinensis]